MRPETEEGGGGCDIQPGPDPHVLNKMAQKGRDLFRWKTWPG